MRTSPFKMFCNERAKKVSAFIYRATMKRVSPSRMRKFSARLLAVRGDNMSLQELNTRVGEEEDAILKENKYNSMKMWTFSGANVMRLNTHLTLQGKAGLRFDEVPSLQRLFFHAMRWAEDDADVYKKRDACFDQVLLAHAK